MKNKLILLILLLIIISGCSTTTWTQEEQDEFYREFHERRWEEWQDNWRDEYIR